ncbi:aminoglycoside 6-adenylyltransferase [Sinomonas sp. JGH33]|uniref:Aminoglycoside 6-adenylyltransferase n=1 Tax=Sinomonas terricola TaxID=3110330 RepID=A0ABU5T7Q9_9MICC|nr:nucleotidyltransferase domain-containing protein [Sinomonas sp. JGH33]MEA5455486.1 aminoglycoside 6-adenylyltransferase [Sinomonas sp. JGH33]
MTKPGDTIPARLRPTLAALASACRDDNRVRSAWLEGSIAQGVADEWSDIDLHLLVESPEEFDAHGWICAIVPLVLADSIPGVPGALIYLTPDWIHIDLVLHSTAESLPDSQREVLLDRDGRVASTIVNPPRPGQPYFPDQQVRIFLYFMGTAVAAHHRGDLIALLHVTAMMRDRLLIQLMLAENGIEAEAGAKRTTRHLNAEQKDCLRSLPAIGVSDASLLQAQKAIVADYLRRAYQLARSCHADWPNELELATKNLWACELAINF